MIPSSMRRGMVAALLASAALPAAASAQTELKLSAPSKDARVEQLKLEVKCATACTAKPTRISATATGPGGLGRSPQLPGGFEASLGVKAKQSKGGRPARFTVNVPAAVSQQVGGAVAARKVAYVYVTSQITPAGGPSFPADRIAVIHTRTVPATVAGGMDDIIVGPAVDAEKGKERYAVTVEGVQTLSWQYNRDEQRDGCRIIANGSGTEELTFTTPRPVMTEILRDKQGTPALVAGDPYPFARVPIRLTAARDGVRNTGVEGVCTGSGGGCDEPGGCGSSGGPPACTRTGSLNGEAIVGFSRRSGRLHAASNMWQQQIPEGQTPDCPVEQWAGYDWHLLEIGQVKRSDPKIAGSAKKFILQETRSRTRRIGGGAVKVSIRWVITFRRL